MIEQINENLINYSAFRINVMPSYFKYIIMNEWWLYGPANIKHNTADKIVTIGCSKELFNMKYIKKKRELTLNDLFFDENNENIELNGCPLLH